MRLLTGTLAVILLGVASASSYDAAPQRKYIPPAPQVNWPAASSYNYVAPTQLLVQSAARPQNVYLPPATNVQVKYQPATKVISIPRAVQQVSVQRPVVRQQLVQPHSVYLPPAAVVQRPAVTISRSQQIALNYNQQSLPRTYLPPQAAATNQYEKNAW